MRPHALKGGAALANWSPEPSTFRERVPADPSSRSLPGLFSLLTSPSPIEVVLEAAYGSKWFADLSASDATADASSPIPDHHRCVLVTTE